MSKTVLNFEESLQHLEEIVKSLETGDLSLDESLAAYEKAMKHAQTCHETLQLVEQKVQIIEVNAGVQTTKPFQVD
jgi:exodeoxyribonuclease VII small subunit